MNAASVHVSATAESHEKQVVAALIAEARAAMDAFADAHQARVDEAVTALAWSIYEPAGRASRGAGGRGHRSRER